MAKLFSESIFLFLVYTSDYMMIGLVLTFLLRLLTDRERLIRGLGDDTMRAAVKAAIISVLLPGCSRSAVSTTGYIKSRGASNSSAGAYFAPKTQNGADSIAVTWGLIGAFMAIYRFIAALLAGLAGGAALLRLRRDNDAENKFALKPSKDGTDKPVISALRYTFVDYIQDIAFGFLAGMVLAAGIAAMLPDTFFEDIVLTQGMLLIIVMLVIVLPVNLCATATVPVCAALMLKGMSPGPAFMLMFAGPIVNVSVFVALSRILGRKRTAVYTVVMAGLALLFSKLIEDLHLAGLFSMKLGRFSLAHGLVMPGVVQLIVAGIFFVLIACAVFTKLRKRFLVTSKAYGETGALVYTVAGMNNSHCAQMVRSLLESIKGVTVLEVNCESGRTALKVSGGAQFSELASAVEAAGCRLERINSKNK